MPPTKPPQPASFIPSLLTLATNDTQLQCADTARYLETPLVSPDWTRTLEVRANLVLSNFATLPAYIGVYFAEQQTNEMHLVKIWDAVAQGVHTPFITQFIRPNANTLGPVSFFVFSYTTAFTLSDNSRQSSVAVFQW